MKKFFVFASVIAALFALTSCNKSHNSELDYYQVVAMFDGLDANMCAEDVYGNNLYGKGYYWLDPVTGLGSKPVQDQFYSGGTAVANFGPMEFDPADNTNWYKKQLSVAFNNLRGFPGLNNSEYCLVSFGYSDPNGWNNAPTINFTDSDTTTRVIDGLYICNTSYAIAQMTTDLGSGAPMSQTKKSWFKVIFTGLNADGTPTGKVEAYLADFRGGSESIIKRWQPVPLASLGRVHGLMIDLESSDNGEYGMNTPAYVAIDGIVVRVDAGTTVKANKNFIKDSDKWVKK